MKFVSSLPKRGELVVSQTINTTYEQNGTLHFFLANESAVIGQVVATTCSCVPISGFVAAFTLHVVNGLTLHLTAESLRQLLR
ncbi:MAG: hypothetical protein ACTS6A_00690 [Candidatus Hodgkinia cicadicola]